MRLMLWKEMRDLRAWLIAGVALAGTIELLLLTRVFSPSFVSIWMVFLMPLTTAVTAIGLGVGQVASERHTRTLDFLLVRPLPAGLIVWTKFLAGTATLALLVGAAVALCYTQPQYTSDSGLQVIREQVGMGQLASTLFPRFWCLYSLSLLFSVLVDRGLKAAALAGVLGITVIGLASVFAELAPFSEFVFWMPFFDGTGGLVAAARDLRISSVTGLVYAAGAILAAAVAAALLKRSSERYLGNRGLALAGAGVITLAVASAYGASVRHHEVSPEGSFQFQASPDSYAAGIVASGRMVAVIEEQSIRFLDFTEPVRPRQVSDIRLPGNSYRAVMMDDSVLLLGHRQALPVDQLEIVTVKAAGPKSAISLGPVRPGDYVSTPVPVGPVVYVAVTRNRVCRLHAFDLESGRELHSVVIDRMLPPMRGREEGEPPVRMVRRGTHLYIASPSYLTAVDVSKPGAPRITSQSVVHPTVGFLYGVARPLAWQGNRLFEIRIFPGTLHSYDLSDPSRPVAKGELTYHGSFIIEGSGDSLYRPWRSGVLEFRGDGDELQARRYLRSDGPVTAVAAVGGYVYTLGNVKKMLRVQAFRVE